jgi:hypothetical protein
MRYAPCNVGEFILYGTTFCYGAVFWFLLKYGLAASDGVMLCLVVFVHLLRCEQAPEYAHRDTPLTVLYILIGCPFYDDNRHTVHI